MNMPLAAMVRPKTIDEIHGQDHILGKDKLLRRMIEADVLSSIIFYGPPGTGKTTLASVIANMTNCNFKAINATTAGKADMKKVTDAAIKNYETDEKKTILFIDEIHRFNKAQQDFLLPFVENGTIILIGATTENPYFEINGALLSRSQIFELLPLNDESLKQIINHALTVINDNNQVKTEITDNAVSFFINISDGDARQILNAIDLGIRTTTPINDTITITEEIASECIQKKVRQYDKNGDNHYDSISAFIESMRHSEVDAALYYLARMITRGEDPKYIARRLMIFAAEDVGLADPSVLTTATNAFLSVERIGLPECVYALTMSTIANSMAPKSNTVPKSYAAAKKDAEEIHNVEIPLTLKDESYKSAWKLGRGGVSDVYANPNHYDAFECMPDALKNHKYFIPSNFGDESKMIPYYNWIESIKQQVRQEISDNANQQKNAI